MDRTSTSASARLTRWGMFAVVILLVGGAFNTVAGIAALSHDDRFRTGELLFGSLSLWGWLWLISGALQLGIAYSVSKRSAAGITVGLFVVGLGAMFHLLAVGAYPLWSVIVIVLDVLILYGLITELDELE